jgi:ribose-phosphate pyrophosphokinase
MKTLNLTNLKQSDIKYQIQKFPDGQQNIVIDRNYKSKINIIDVSQISRIQIKSRLNNWLDLELIVASVASLRELGVEEIHLYTPYIMGARSDRKFEKGGNNYLKDVICPIINSLNFKTVTCIDPHSDVLEACIKGFRKESNYRLVSFTLDNLYPKSYSQKEYILVSPDAGASKKIYKLAEQIGYKGDIITCSKDRDENGKLTKTVIPYTMATITDCKDYIIIDDICDGGATFINIAKALLEKFESEEWDGYRPKIYLIVAHSIFSKGTNELLQYFDGIYCTNSYIDLNNMIPFINISKNGNHFIKQLNVF